MEEGYRMEELCAGRSQTSSQTSTGSLGIGKERPQSTYGVVALLCSKESLACPPAERVKDLADKLRLLPGQRLLGVLG
jgi:hypothetical protein